MDFLADFRASGSPRARKLACRGPFSSPTCLRTFVRHACFSSRGCQLWMCSCTRLRVQDKLSCTRLQNYTIGASLMSVSVPWGSNTTLMSHNRKNILPPTSYLPDIINIFNSLHLLWSTASPRTCLLLTPHIIN